MTTRTNGGGRIDELLNELEGLLKDPHVGMQLGGRGINQSFALVAAQALRAYLDGQKYQAADDFAMVADEIRARLVDFSDERNES